MLNINISIDRANVILNGIYDNLNLHLMETNFLLLLLLLFLKYSWANVYVRCHYQYIGIKVCIQWFSIKCQFLFLCWTLVAMAIANVNFIAVCWKKYWRAYAMHTAHTKKQIIYFDIIIIIIWNAKCIVNKVLDVYITSLSFQTMIFMWTCT